MNLRTPAFDPDDRIPARHTGDADDLSPALEWSDVPDDAVELAIIVDDPDAPTDQPWVHWVVYNIPASEHALPEGVPREEAPAEPEGIAQGVNSFPDDNLGYRGPAPPPGHGPHHYHFRLYALDTNLALAPGADKTALLNAMRDHVIAEAELVGTYER
jgi:Raf kinase inhibitor-like YbhB/YbcL family protein